MGRIIYSCAVDQDDIAKMVDEKNKRVPLNFKIALLHKAIKEKIPLERSSVIHNLLKKRTEEKVYWNIEIKQEFEEAGFLDEPGKKGTFTVEKWQPLRQAPAQSQQGALELTGSLDKVDEVHDYDKKVSDSVRKGKYKLRKGGLSDFQKDIKNRALSICRQRKGLPEDPNEWTSVLLPDGKVDFIINLSLKVF